MSVIGLNDQGLKYYLLGGTIIYGTNLQLVCPRYQFLFNNNLYLLSSYKWSRPKSTWRINDAKESIGRPSDEGYSIKQRRLLGNCFYACIIWCMDSLNAQVSIKCVFSFGNSEHFRTFNTTAQLFRIMVKIFLSLRVWFYNILWFIFFPTQFLLRPIKVAYNLVQKVCNWFCFVYERRYYLLKMMLLLYPKYIFPKFCIYL